jgi:DNA-binding beta-propeller fold protein YncE
MHSGFVTVNPVNNRVYVSNGNDATVTVIQE